jgi:hypothetical protein
MAINMASLVFGHRPVMVFAEKGKKPRQAAATNIAVPSPFGTPGPAPLLHSQAARKTGPAKPSRQESNPQTPGINRGL